MADEYTSNAETTDSDADSDASGKEKKEKKKKKSAKTVVSFHKLERKLS